MDTLEMQSKALYHCHHCGHDQHISAVVTAAKDVQTHDVDGKIESEKLTTAKCCECAREMWEVHATWHLTYGKVQHTRTTNAIYKALRTSCGEVVAKADTGIKPIREVKESAFTVKFTPVNAKDQENAVRSAIERCYRNVKAINNVTEISEARILEIIASFGDSVQTRFCRKSTGTEYSLAPMKIAYVHGMKAKLAAEPEPEVIAPVEPEPVKAIAPVVEPVPVVRNTPRPPRPYFALKTIELEAQAKSDLPGVLHELTFRKSNAAMKLLETLSVGVK